MNDYKSINYSPSEWLVPNEQYGSLKVADSRPNNIVFYNGGGMTEANEVMRIDKDGVRVPPHLTVDEATKGVIKVLDLYVRGLAQKEYERGVVDGMQKQLKQIVEKSV